LNNGGRDGASSRSNDLGSFLDLPQSSLQTQRRGAEGRQTGRDDRHDTHSQNAEGRRASAQEHHAVASEQHQQQASQVRDNFEQAYAAANAPQYPYAADWAQTHPYAAHHIAYGYHPFAVATWAAAGAWVGAAYSSGYGTSVVYEGDTVYVDGEASASPEAYAEQATQIAARESEEAEEWLPLGVFALTPADASDANMLVQIAIAKNGAVSGSYYHTLTETTLPLQGSFDKASQRAAWTFGDNSNVVYETSLGNLTLDDAPLLVHFADGRTQEWRLVRLPGK